MHCNIIFRNRNGKPWKLDSVVHKIKKALISFVEELGKEETKSLLARELKQISAKDVRRFFSTLAEPVLYCDERALGMYLGHRAGSIRETHYTARDIDFLRREIVEKIEKLLAGTIDKTMDKISAPKTCDSISPEK